MVSFIVFITISSLSAASISTRRYGIIVISSSSQFPLKPESISFFTQNSNLASAAWSISSSSGFDQTTSCSCPAFPFFFFLFFAFSSNLYNLQMKI
uniref:Secreted protein n=1 Tax=Panstrongylus lignarius TaxID=156445 RepID=A0A224XR70_9HEMI